MTTTSATPKNAPNANQRPLTADNILPVIEQVSALGGYACAVFPIAKSGPGKMGLDTPLKCVIYQVGLHASPHWHMDMFTLGDWDAYRTTLKAREHSFPAVIDTGQTGQVASQGVTQGGRRGGDTPDADVPA